MAGLWIKMPYPAYVVSGLLGLFCILTLESAFNTKDFLAAKFRHGYKMLALTTCPRSIYICITPIIAQLTASTAIYGHTIHNNSSLNAILRCNTLVEFVICTCSAYLGIILPHFAAIPKLFLLAWFTVAHRIHNWLFIIGILMQPDWRIMISSINAAKNNTEISTSLIFAVLVTCAMILWIKITSFSQTEPPLLASIVNCCSLDDITFTSYAKIIYLTVLSVYFWDNSADHRLLITPIAARLSCICFLRRRWSTAIFIAAQSLTTAIIPTVKVAPMLKLIKISLIAFVLNNLPFCWAGGGNAYPNE